MIEGLNHKEIAKQIKASGKHGYLIWSRQKKQHFISNRHFLLNVEEVPSEILISLFAIFLKIPAVGETLVCNFGRVQDEESQKPIKFDQIYMPDKQSIKGQVTPFIKDYGDKISMRIIKFPDRFTYINEQYMKMTSDREPISTDIAMAPVYFADNSLILLPYRINDKPEESILTGLIGETD
ncbi:hypothetical protein [Paenibacillus macerans]|uniref:hypothetical protein n=1 Tax=Paenibacillus macerans TaxID=44252 RepID=UPI003D310ADA